MTVVGVLRSLRSTSSRFIRLLKTSTLTESLISRPDHTCSYRWIVNAHSSTAHRFNHKSIKARSCLTKITASDMDPLFISYGTAGAPDDNNDEEEEESAGGAREGVGELKKRLEDDSFKERIITPAQVNTASTDLKKELKKTDVSKLSKSVEKNVKRISRREKRKMMKKKDKSHESSDILMLELPFALTSPTAWKELGFSNQDSSQKRKRKRGDSGGRLDSEEDVGKKKKKECQRPNYFISIPITNTQISTAVTEVQEAILQQEPLLAKAMIPVPTLHITLLVTHLANQEQVDLAGAVLVQVRPLLADLLGRQDLVLPFSGISHFRKEVVFVGLAPGQHRHTLDSLAELLRKHFEERGLLQGNNRGFEPHLTIMKLSRASKLRAQGIKRVDPALFSNYTNRFFGDQTVERVDLCSMLKKKQQDGYYHTEMSLQIDLVRSPLHKKQSSGRRRSEPDEAELLRISKRLVDDAVSRALQQYKQETLQNGGGPNASAVQPPGSTEDVATKTNTVKFTSDCKK